jgi:MYXO-CTERM domain-containing protein
MTIPEAARMMLKLGAVDAINLDGGGSTTFVVRGNVLNKPSDRAVPSVAGAKGIVKAANGGRVIASNVERPVASALVVVKRPVAPAKVAVSVSPGQSDRVSARSADLIADVAAIEDVRPAAQTREQPSRAPLVVTAFALAAVGALGARRLRRT